MWHVTAEPILKDGCFTFMQEVDGKATRFRVMGTVIAEGHDTRDELPRDA